MVTSVMAESINVSIHFVYVGILHCDNFYLNISIFEKYFVFFDDASNILFLKKIVLQT